MSSRSTRVIRRATAAAAVLLLALLAPTGALAQALLTAQIGGTTQQTPSGLASLSIPTTFGSHAATARYGVLTSSSALAFPGRGSETGPNTIATFQDDLTITDPGAAPGPATLRALVRVTGGPTYSASQTSPAVVQGMNTGYQLLSLRNGGSANVVDGRILFDTSAVPQESIVNTVPAPGLIEVEFVFSYGFPVNVGFQLVANAGGNNSFFPPDDGSISGSTDVVLVWEGISSITDGAGNERLANATITSASGTDWTGSLAPPAVPTGGLAAPLAVALGLVALGTLALRARAARPAA